MKFTKMQGLGNDYLYFFGDVPENVVELAKKLSDRRFGVGSDGLIFIGRSDAADFSMRIFNADGSEAKMCGNGIRCVGKYVHDRGLTEKTDISVETLSGIKRLTLELENGKTVSVGVKMGAAEASDEIKVEGLSIIPVSVGNPHAVIFCRDAETEALTDIGRALNISPEFPGGVNVELVSRLGQRALRMRVYERGSGVTLACGTGACAAAAAAVKLGMCEPDTPIDVVLDGGTLTITVENTGEVYMRGPAEFVCDCEISE